MQTYSWKSSSIVLIEVSNTSQGAYKFQQITIIKLVRVPFIHLTKNKKSDCIGVYILKINVNVSKLKIF